MKQELMREVEANRFKQAQQFYKWLNANKATLAPLKQKRVSLRDGYDSDDDKNYKIDIIVS